MISIRNVRKSFGPQVVLNGVSFDIQPGETTTVVGPSGVGKSVLLKLIMGILSPDSGKIFIFDDCITDAKTEHDRNKIRARLGVLFQSAALFDSLTVYDNIAFPLLERGRVSRQAFSTREIHKKVCLMMSKLGLEPHAHHFPEEISMGLRKRVGLARSLITEPDVLLIDEPNTGLDPFVGQEVYDLIKTCRKEWGFTGVVISHELPEVFQVSDRIVMLLKGNIVIEGTPQDIIDSDSAAVQQFLHGKTDGPIKIQ